MEFAKKTWELDNNVQLVNPERDALYNYNSEAHKNLCDEKPWKANPNYFTHVRVSAVALIKMVMHARSGGSIEVMGLMQGYITGTSLVITDAFRLPVEGTETRVNAQDDANEYMVEYLTRGREQGRAENAIGWYHSHPGYGCWLSGIDVGTQFLQQSYNEPFVAVVIDPDRTISAGKVEIGAFRTYPEGHKSSSNSRGNGGEEVGSDGFQAVPMNKVEDFGAHSEKYYSLEVVTYKSTLDNQILDLLWHKYWVQTLSQNPLLTNREYSSKQMADLAGQTALCCKNFEKSAAGRTAALQGNVHKQMEKVQNGMALLASKEYTGLAAIEVRKSLFNGLGKEGGEEVALPLE
ncbi:uncharacterized protein MKZ38_009530 [Zalerion maritima]|uniref:COP9 signalosome complex subunit 5 n=1 Tax=Zalerion maritima TaxID=339359 RepID=A0AAD5RTE2_9PEZI|nr:uncharacterized protein MKZ38_009530 [Zalerion maritima]